MGRMNLQCFGGLRVKFQPTKHILFILLFQHFFFLLPERITSNISASVIGLTFSTGTDHFPAFSFLFCLTMLVSTLEFLCCSLSMRQVGTAPSSMGSTLLLAFFSSCYLIVFFICIFCLKRSLLNSLALSPLRLRAFLAMTLDFLASFFLRFSSASNLQPYRFLCRSIQSFCGIVPSVENDIYLQPDIIIVRGIALNKQKRSFGGQHDDDNYYKKCQSYQDDTAHTFFVTLHMLLSFHQLFLSLLYIVLALSHICLDTVDLLTLREHQRRQLIEQHHTLVH